MGCDYPVDTNIIRVGYRSYCVGLIYHSIMSCQ
jgi:hypothetical protein